MRIKSITHGILRESTQLGRPCVFVDLAEVNTPKSECVELPTDEVVDVAAGFGYRIIAVRGKCPLASEGTKGLVKALLDRSLEVLVRSPAYAAPRGLDRRSRLLLDIPSPSTTLSSRVNFGLLGGFSSRSEIRFTIARRCEYVWALRIIKECNLENRTVFFRHFPTSPLIAEALVAWLLADRVQARVCFYSLQNSLPGVDETNA